VSRHGVVDQCLDADFKCQGTVCEDDVNMVKLRDKCGEILSRYRTGDSRREIADKRLQCVHVAKNKLVRAHRPADALAHVAPSMSMRRSLTVRQGRPKTKHDATPDDGAHHLGALARVVLVKDVERKARTGRQANGEQYPRISACLI
jgi:hypothetical protein